MPENDQPTEPQPNDQRTRLTNALRRVVLLKETGPKNAAWHRARVQTIWRLHRLLDQVDRIKPDAQTPPPAHSDEPKHDV